jgi:hypothetical protein
VAGAYYVAVTYAERFPPIHGGHEAWRYTLLSGMIPAIPFILVRPFLLESPIWREKKSQGDLETPQHLGVFPACSTKDHPGHYAVGRMHECPGDRSTFLEDRWNDRLRHADGMS